MTKQKFEEEIKKNAEEFGKRAEAWGKEVEKEWSESGRGKTSEYIASIIINLILLAIWGRLPEWLPFLTNSFAAVLPLFYISFALTIIANFLFLAVDENSFIRAGKILLNLISILVMVSLYYIYPFDFASYAGYWDIIIRIVIIVAIFGTAVAVIVETIKLLVGENSKKTGK